MLQKKFNFEQNIRPQAPRSKKNMLRRLVEPNELIPFQWIDISDPHAPELEQMATEFSLPHYAVNDCLEPDHLPKYEAIGDGHHFIILRLYNPKKEKHKQSIQDFTSKIAIFFNEHFILSIHRLPYAFMDGIQQKYLQTGIIDRPIEVVVKILWYALHSFEVPANNLVASIEAFESRIFLRENIPNLQQDLYYLKRRATVCRNILFLTLEVVQKIQTTPCDRSSLQDAMDLHTRLSIAFQQINEDTINLLHSYHSITSQRNNDIVKVLTIFSVFFMPLTFIAGIYGMNFEHMPELRHPWGYPSVLLLMVVVVFFIWWWFKRKRWL